MNDNVNCFLIDYKNIFRSINILLSNNEEEILKKINLDDDESFLFLSGVVGIISNEKEFFTIKDNLVNKVINVVCRINDNVNLSKIDSSLTYSILYFMNAIRRSSDLENNINFFDYVGYNETVRDVVIDTKAQLINYLEYDYILLEKLNNDDFNFDKDLFLASSYYLVNVFPEMYSSKMIKKSMDFLDRCQDFRYFSDEKYKNRVNNLKRIFRSFDVEEYSDNLVSFNKFKDKE